MKKYFVKASIVSLFVLNLFPLISQSKSRTFNISKNISIYNSVLRELDMYYVDTLDHNKLVKSSIDNMLRGLDPYTVYIPEEESDDLTFMTSGEYAGIGALITTSENYICISEPYEGMPAQINGLKAGDILLTIDGKSTKNMKVSDASQLLKGSPKTTVELKVKRPGSKKEIEFKFQRQKISVNPISFSKIYSDSIAYIMLSDFTSQASSSFKSTLDSLNKISKISTLIFDLRGNGGGLIDEAVKIMGNFVPKGTEIVKTKGKIKQTESTYSTTKNPDYGKMKLIVLTNNSTASASEIVAGSIQDLDRGLIVGERTYGKGLVQNIRPVGFGGNLKVTTAKYYIPSGRCIQAIDYSHRKEDGSLGYVPDSLTSEFKTAGGRTVKDGGGIVPDSVIDDKKKVNIAFHLYVQNMFFDFATQFAIQHQKIDSPEIFQVSDEVFNDFKSYLKTKDFKYESQTSHILKELKESAEEEGLTKYMSEEIEKLQKNIKPDIDRDLEDNKDEIKDLIALEIIKRYYFQKGMISYSLQNDKVLKSALKISQK